MGTASGLRSLDSTGAVNRQLRVIRVARARKKHCNADKGKDKIPREEANHQVSLNGCYQVEGCLPLHIILIKPGS